MSHPEMEDVLRQAKDAARHTNHTEALRLVQLILRNTSPQEALHSSALFILIDVERDKGNYPEVKKIALQVLDTAEQQADTSTKAAAWNIIGLACRNLGEYQEALEYFNKALEVYREQDERSLIAGLQGNIGATLYNTGQFNQALEYYRNALLVYEEEQSNSGIAMVKANIALLYQSLGKYSEALEYYEESLRSSIQLDNKNATALVINNIGIIYAEQGLFEKALSNYEQAHLLYTELDNKSGIATSKECMGNALTELRQYYKALDCYTQALIIHKEIGIKSHIASITGNIGCLYSRKEFEGYDIIKAEEHLLQSIELSTEIGFKDHLRSMYKSLADLYKQQKRWEECQLYFEKFYEAEKEIQLKEAKRAAEDFEYERKSAIRERELAIERTRMQERENILNNILPEEITARLIRGENPIADHFPAVSILFMDIVDFTPISSQLPAQELIHLLNHIFTIADDVIQVHGLEKIKTIGDAYMAASGTPLAQPDHALRAAKAALDLRDAMKNLAISSHLPSDELTWIQNLQTIRVRIGLHSGSTIGGVIGKKKFSFDLWGDTVNTAARMESHGEPGKIHVSEEFVQQLAMNKGQLDMPETEKMRIMSVANYPLTIILRGELDIKGKGTMRTYFLERE